MEKSLLAKQNENNKIDAIVDNLNLTIIFLYVTQ